MVTRIEIADLVVARGPARLAGPLDIALGAGEILSVTGPNGAGKSTLLRMLFGLLPVEAGRIVLSGLDGPDGEPARVLREAAHYVGHRHAMKASDSVGAGLAFWRRFLKRPALGVEEALDAVGLAGTAALPFGLLSAGQQRRVALARLLVAHRPVWLLDEPTSALDAASQDLFAALVRRHLDGGGLVIAATHLPLGLSGRELRLAGPASPSGWAGTAFEDEDPWQ